MENTKDVSLPVATIFERLFAFLVDYLPVTFIISGVTWFVFSTFPEAGLRESVYIVLFFHGLFILYSAFFSSGGRKTLGKFLLGIRVVRADGGNLSFGRALWRSFGYYIDMFATVFIGFAIALFTKNKRALHDFLAGSMVVTEREKSASEMFVTAISGTLLIGAAALFVVLYLKTMAMPGDQEKIALAERAAQNIALLEEAHYEHYGFFTSDINRLALISGDPVQFQRDIQWAVKRRGMRIGIDPKSEKLQNAGLKRPLNLRVPEDEASFQVLVTAKDSKQTQILYP